MLMFFKRRQIKKKLYVKKPIYLCLRNRQTTINITIYTKIVFDVITNLFEYDINSTYKLFTSKVMLGQHHGDPVTCLQFH